MIAPLLLVVLVGPVDAADANRRAAQILGDVRYGFCHEPGYNLTEDEAELCPPVAPSPNPRCPRFHQACTAPRATLDDEVPFRLQQSRSAGEAPSGDGRREARTGDRVDDPRGGETRDGTRLTPRRRVPREEAAPVMPELRGLGQVLFWGVLIVGALAIVVAIVRNSLGGRREDRSEAPAEALGGSPEAVAAVDRAGLARDVAAMLERARAAAGAGDFAAAIRAAHAALLYRLDSDGLIRVEASRTNGDYLHDLRERPELRGEVREVVREVERVQFGSEAADRTRFERIFVRAAAIAARAGPLGLALLWLTGCPIGQPAPWDDSPSGSRAVIELAATREIAVEFRQRPLSGLAADDEAGPRTIVLMHDLAEPTPAAWERVTAWVRAGGHLIVAGGPLPPDLGFHYEDGAGGGPGLSLTAGAAELLGLQGPDALEFVSPGRRALAVDGTARALVVRGDGSVYAAHRMLGLGLVTALADDRVFTNVGLSVGDNPALALALLAAAEGRVELIDGLLDWGADGPADALRQLRLTPVILQLLLLALVFYACRGVHFGRPRAPAERSRRRFAEHVEALGLQYARARATRYAARQYAAWALERLRDRASTGGQGGLYGVAQAVATRTGADETTVYQTLVEASSLRDPAAGQSLAAAGTRDAAGPGELRVMQELARLIRATGGPK